VHTLLGVLKINKNMVPTGRHNSTGGSDTYERYCDGDTPYQTRSYCLARTTRFTIGISAMYANKEFKHFLLRRCTNSEHYEIVIHLSLEEFKKLLEIKDCVTEEFDATKEDGWHPLSQHILVRVGKVCAYDQGPYGINISKTNEIKQDDGSVKIEHLDKDSITFKAKEWETLSEKMTKIYDQVVNPPPLVEEENPTEEKQTEDKPTEAVTQAKKDDENEKKIAKS